MEKNVFMENCLVNFTFWFLLTFWNISTIKVSKCIKMLWCWLISSSYNYHTPTQQHSPLWQPNPVRCGCPPPRHKPTDAAAGQSVGKLSSCMSQKSDTCSWKSFLYEVWINVSFWGVFLSLRVWTPKKATCCIAHSNHLIQTPVVTSQACTVHTHSHTKRRQMNPWPSWPSISVLLSSFPLPFF